MKINIASFGGRSHLLDTARELEKYGHEVRFYSFVPTKRATQFGLKKECSKSYFIIALPFLTLQKITKGAEWTRWLFHCFFDYYIALTMKPCDVFIGHRAGHKFCLNFAKKKYRAVVILEDGSSHVLNQKKFFESYPDSIRKPPFAKWHIKKSLAAYQIADYISIASDFVKRTMLENGISENKLFINPYGIDLQQFYPTEKPDDAVSYDVIMVGGWSYRKGCDLLIDAIRNLNLRFLHIGGIVDLKFPNYDNFTHYNSINQWELVNYYANAKVFVLTSREEGLALVQAQALACGLPIVCSKNTGGSNLKDFLNDKKWIIEMTEYTVNCLTDCITQALQLAASQPEGKRDYAGEAIQNLTWEAYGKRYNDFLKKIVNK